MKKSRTYSHELKVRALKEYDETSSFAEVAKRNNIPVTTLRSWILKRSGKKTSHEQKRHVERLEKELAYKDIEIQILKDLLKKTNQAWLKD
jgi:transposase-like protein